MPGVCSNSWQTYGCDWTIRYLWRWTDSWERYVLVGLALMLAHVVFVLTSVGYRCHIAQRPQEIDPASRAFQRSRRKLFAEMGLKVGTLKSIASTAPYLGLVGTCVGILGIFSGYVGTRFGAVIMTVFGLDAAFISTASGLLVAVAAVLSYNYLRTKIDSLQREVAGNTHERTGQSFQVAQKLPLTARFSQIPFAVIAAPSLAVSIMAFMTFSSFHTLRGLHVGLASDRCELEGDDRPIVLRITDAGELFINQTQEDWNSLAGRLSEIYRTRVHHTLYLRADDGVPFQSVARALDIVENARRVNVGSGPVRMGPDRLDITVQLLTPKALSAHCLEPVSIGPSLHALR
jgi:biopolymer transport protein ExbD